MDFVYDMRKCKKELEDTRGEVSKLREENMVLRRRGKSAEERCNRLSEEVNSMHEKEHEIINLRSKNRELENEKVKVEPELEILRKRFEKLDKRVLCLEIGFNTLQDKDDSKNNNKILGEIRVFENERLKSAEANRHAPNILLSSYNSVDALFIDESLKVFGGGPHLSTESTNGDFKS
ncbi:hypothetical protein Goshw_029469 [Gossypium schwendimanii]|uniref:Uncharacterized protein n=1 Tax=Gossypium schwendimanii TaxID=34291 RepID=A0A7J9MKW1_GOSSC|nr:hypothetical protein [Gossypium schwendimanii]